VIKLFLDGDVDEVRMIYTKFVSSMTQETKSMRLLPLEPPGSVKDDDDEIVRMDSSGETIVRRVRPATYDPSPEAVFNRIIPNFLSGLIQSGITESYTSELCARQMAMESASDNAEDMIGNLSLLYNRARQEKITNEINEIVGGANAL
jgi:F-type H+-transporting ATPase subunit gamma